jgi:nicotinamide-nucleotide amidase
VKAEIITIGDEILIGQTIDTNSAWLGEQLHLIGVKLNRIISISDTPEAIRESIDESFLRADLILMTGGLGPTQDDITKETLAQYFNTILERNQEVVDEIDSYFRSKGLQMLEANRRQADLPKDAKILDRK